MNAGLEYGIQGRRLGGKVALVTGASRGIGRAIALRLAREGAFTVIHYRHEEASAQALVEEIEGASGAAWAIQADLGTMTGIERLVRGLEKGLLERLGSTGLDILINNAGIASQGTLGETTEAAFDEVFAVNVKAPFFLLQALVPRLRDGGRIINLSSLVTRMAYPPEAAYAMTKGAIDTLSLLLAKELGPRGITVNALAPGVIDTDMNAQLLSDSGNRRYVESLSALGRVGTVEEVADAAAFLAGPDSRWITGQYLDVSGGSFLG